MSPELLNGQPLAIVDAAGVVSYILNDQVGQPHKMLNTAGTITWQRNSGIFGDTVSQPTGTTAANPQRFPGQQFDPNTTLHYNYFRDYDPVTGRYLETDPIGLTGGINLYGYVDGNPVSRIDPEGLNPAAAVRGAVIVGEVTGEGLAILCRRYPKQCMATIGGAAIWVANAMKPWVNHPDADREHLDYKRAYAAPMPPGMDECAQLAWKLAREKAQLAARQAWDAKWMEGRHATPIGQSQNAIRNLEDKMKKLGCEC